MKTLFRLLPALFFTQTALAVNPTPDFYKCTGKVGGEWNYGRAPNGCNGSDFGSDSVVRDTFGALIFQDAKSRTPERNRYMEELHSVIRDAAAYYIKKRKPEASSAEVAAFQLGILTTAAQETYWSHYRFASDNRIKMMRGDFGHGHGMMQVDDRHHFPAVQQGLGWNLIGNLTYAMDEFYANWQRAPGQSCVGSATNWTARIRASWAAYNGGPSKLCRWTNPNDRWAHNDKGFYSHLTGQRWKSYVADLEKAAPINVPCLIEKRENCPAPGEPTRPVLKANTLYRTPAGMPCVLVGAGLQCLEEFRDAACLRAVSAFTNETAEVIEESLLQDYTVEKRDRHSTCQAFEPSLIPVGRNAEAMLNINLRATPGGGLVGLFPRAEVAQVLDFEVRGLTSRDRYYKVKVNGVTGFVYAGNASTHANWVTATNKVPLPTTRARPGEWIKIVNRYGINLRATAAGTYVLNVPVGTMLAVQEVTVNGDTNKVYYKVSYNRKTGWIYTGTLLPTETIADWTKRNP